MCHKAETVVERKNSRTCAATPEEALHVHGDQMVGVQSLEKLCVWVCGCIRMAVVPHHKRTRGPLSPLVERRP